MTAEEIFNEKSYFNKWLKELTDSEKHLIIEMLNEFASQKDAWIKVSEKRPRCYKTGNWDGKMSDEIFVRNDKGHVFVGVCYEGILDGSEFLDFYSNEGFNVGTIIQWMEIPN